MSSSVLEDLKGLDALFNTIFLGPNKLIRSQFQVKKRKVACDCKTKIQNLFFGCRLLCVIKFFSPFSDVACGFGLI
jgi:hypothetical protein